MMKKVASQKIQCDFTEAIRFRVIWFLLKFQIS